MFSQKKKITSIGIIGYGQFGKFIHAVCNDLFPEVSVHISSRSHPNAQPFEDVCKADIVFPCAPISCMEEQLKSIVPHLGEASIIREICTVKVHPWSVLEQFPGVQYICSHPMFGPESYKKKRNSLEGLTLARCGDTLGKDLHTTFIEMLNSVGLSLVFLSPQEHDKKLAETLFLTHYVSQVIYQAEFNRSDIDTVSFGFLMDAVESVKDNEELFKDVWKFNPYCREVVERFARTNEQVLSSLVQ